MTLVAEWEGAMTCTNSWAKHGGGDLAGIIPTRWVGDGGLEAWHETGSVNVVTFPDAQGHVVIYRREVALAEGQMDALFSDLCALDLNGKCRRLVEC